MQQRHLWEHQVKPDGQWSHCSCLSVWDETWQCVGGSHIHLYCHWRGKQHNMKTCFWLFPPSLSCSSHSSFQRCFIGMKYTRCYRSSKTWFSSQWRKGCRSDKIYYLRGPKDVFSIFCLISQYSFMLVLGCYLKINVKHCSFTVYIRTVFMFHNSHF